MDVEFAAVLRFDFALEPNGSELEGKLDSLYSSRTEDVDPTFFGFAPASQLETRGTGSITRFSDVDYGELSGQRGPFTLDEFGAIQSFLLHPDSRRFYDLVTVAEFSDEQIETIAEADVEAASERVAHWQGQVSRIGRYVDSLVYDEEIFGETSPLYYHQQILYVVLDETRDLRDDDGDLRTDACDDVVSEPICRKYLLGERGCVSLLGSGELVGTQRLGDVWGPLTATAVSKPREKFRVPGADEFDLPPLGTLVNRLLPFFRAYDWAHLRLADTEITDQELTESSANVNELQEDDERRYLTELAERETELGQVQKYLDYSKMTQEFDDVVRLIGGYRYDRDESHRDDYEQPLSKPSDTTLRSTTYFEDSLLATYRNELTHLFETLESNLDRIDEKQKRISNIITDKVTVTGTKASVELNDRVRKLTWVLVALTVVLVAIPVFSNGSGGGTTAGESILRGVLDLLESRVPFVTCLS
ncbi:hypothetical protein BRC81_01710 [Halobacteriales archaeon QS_1_68_20]|nr:MAG: hypothetical protein BRC81_01710 [Halobacteriales archaeon QS_1_68_20]